MKKRARFRTFLNHDEILSPHHGSNERWGDKKIADEETTRALALPILVNW